MINNEKGYVRELLEQLIGGAINNDQARAALYSLDEQLRAAKNVEQLWWWVVCKDHSSKYRTEAKAHEVRQAIEQLTRERPNLGCHNEHLIIQSAVDPRGEQGNLFESVANTVAAEDIPPDQPGDPWYNVADKPELQPEDEWESTCWQCGEQITGEFVVPVRVKVPGVGWRSRFIHALSENAFCWGAFQASHREQRQEWSDPPAPPPVHIDEQVSSCARCSRVIVKSVDGHWVTYGDSIKVCHPFGPDGDTAHSEHVPSLESAQ